MPLPYRVNLSSIAWTLIKLCPRFCKKPNIINSFGTKTRNSESYYQVPSKTSFSSSYLLNHNLTEVIEWSWLQGTQHNHHHTNDPLPLMVFIGIDFWCSCWRWYTYKHKHAFSESSNNSNYIIYNASYCILMSCWRFVDCCWENMSETRIRAVTSI
jgi:hypothetical protein